MSVCQLKLAHWEPGTLHLTSQGIHILHVTHTPTHTHTNTHTLRPLLPQPLLHGLAGLPASHSLPWKPESLCLIRVIETGPPETKELLNCYPLAHLKDHLIKPLCVYVLFSLFLIIPLLFFVILFFQSFFSSICLCQVIEWDTVKRLCTANCQ